MREALRQVRPTEFEDLIALVALYRPGPMQYIPVYARRKHGLEQVAYRGRAPASRSPADATGSRSTRSSRWRSPSGSPASRPAEADDLRKAIGKKIHSLMASLKEKFIAGCIANGDEPEVARQLWDDMEKAQDYSFNKSHAACYALIAYRTAWLKAHHPHEYMAALISSVMNTKDRVPFYVNACHELGIEVLPPGREHVAARLRRRRGEDPLRAERGQERRRDRRAARSSRRARRAAPFASIWDFTERVDPQVVNKRALESLVKCGALDSTGASRRGMVEVLDQALSWGGREQADRIAGQGSIFDLAEDAGRRARRGTIRPISAEEYEKSELLRLEKETLGLWVSEHPLAGDRRPAAAQDRPAARRARALPRRRDRRRRRDRLARSSS